MIAPTEIRIDLASYLEHLYRCLEPLPKKLRANDMAEMTQHLTSAISECLAQGCSKEAAQAHVLAQFGSPQDIGRSIVGAWRKETLAKNRVTFAVTFGFLGLAAFLDTLQSPSHFGVDSMLSTSAIFLASNWPFGMRHWLHYESKPVVRRLIPIAPCAVLIAITLIADAVNIWNWHTPTRSSGLAYVFGFQVACILGAFPYVQYLRRRPGAGVQR